MQKIITNTFNETQKLGYQFANKLKRGGVIALYGNLGSGKTTFVQGLAAGLGIEKKIISPTFIIIRKYEIPLKSVISNLRSFYHIDLYRIENVADLESLGLTEIINDPENIIAIEWPEKIEKLLPAKRIDLHFEYLPAGRQACLSGRQGLENDKRKISISSSLPTLPK